MLRSLESEEVKDKDRVKFSSNEKLSITEIIIPSELMICIFSFLKPTANDLKLLMLVNKYWDVVANNNILWDTLVNSYREINKLSKNLAGTKWKSESSKTFYKRLTGNMQLFGKTMTDVTVTIDVKRTDTIGTIRKKIAEKIHYPDPDYLDLKRLRSPTQILYNDMTLSQAGIGVEETLHMFSTRYKRS